MPYRVRVADNMRREKEYERRMFATLEDAEQTAEAIVESSLHHLCRLGMSAPELVGMWHRAGADPYVIPPAGEPLASFHASDYVRQRAPILRPAAAS